MLDEFLNSIKSYPDFQRKWVDDLNQFLKRLDPNSSIIATHGHCPDGIVAGSMIRYDSEFAEIIPIDYWVLNGRGVRERLEDLHWKGIVDLEPFNKRPTEYWVDHHIGVLGKKINSQKIRYDYNGESGSFQLLLSNFLRPMPDKIIELVTLTRITDTASYTFIPPTYELDEDNEILNTRYESLNLENKTAIQHKAYVLDDAVRSISTFEEMQKTYDGLAKEGFIFLFKYKQKINQLRIQRLKEYEIAENLPKADCLVFKFDDGKLTPYSFHRKLLNSKCFVSISVAKVPDGYKLSFRRKKGLNPEMNKILQLHNLAKQFNGGGHEAASGGFTTDFDNFKLEMERWSLKNNLSIQFCDVEL